MRLTDDKKIRKSIIRLFTFTEQIIILKSFRLVKHETRDDFSTWLKGLAYDFMESAKNMTFFFIMLVVFTYISPPKSHHAVLIFNNLIFIYPIFLFLAILNKARIIGCGYLVGIKLFIFCIKYKIFFLPESQNKAYPPLNTQGIKIYIDDDKKARKRITDIFTFKEQLTLLRCFSLERENTHGYFLAWLNKTSADFFSSTKVMFIILFILFIITIIQNPEAWHYIFIIFFIFMMPLMTLICIFATSHMMDCKFITSVKLLYFSLRKK
ncbi:hypothetical protein L7750_05115 [Xenorhabdus bovienii]|uniref:hypothetical protein n=1 Tax=Xenorhabdus bovienii TaxID=40576 RepID=UPI001EDDA7E3|nr:hypothetical protein [Xenorhabdus bovienii]MCG3469796.1 hypothetical protein [Xenorhabdus bovienii]